jgi:hypothetical protein
MPEIPRKNAAKVPGKEQMPRCQRDTTKRWEYAVAGSNPLRAGESWKLFDSGLSRRRLAAAGCVDFSRAIPAPTVEIE